MRKIIGVLATALLAVGPLVAAAPASAGLPGQNGKLTLWQNDGYQGQELSRYEYDSNLHNDKCSGCDPGPGGNFGDDASSFVNKSKYWWGVWVDRDYGRYAGGGYDNTVFCIRPYSHDANLGNNGFSNLEDEISSIRRFSGQPDILSCGRDHSIGAKN